MSPSRAFRHVLPLVVLATLGVALVALAVQRDSRKPKKYAVLVGVKEYAHPKLRGLQYTENDATEMAALLRFHDYQVTLLCDSQGKKDGKLAPTKANVKRELKRVLDGCRKGDLVLVGLSGHGLQFDGDRENG
jgi:uncharacterized caspase-like protein